MGRRSTVDASKFVYYDITSDTSTCVLCHRVLSGNLLGNIKRHYVKIHNWDFENNGKPPLIPTPAPIMLSTTGLTTDHRLDLLPRSLALKRRRSSSMPNVAPLGGTSKEDFLKCCVGLVTTTEAPLAIFDDELYFKQIIAPYEEAYGLNMNASVVLEYVQSCAQKIKQQLTRQLHGKMLCLKANVASAEQRSFLSVGVQYLQNMKVTFHTLGIVELGQERTASYLKELLVQCLTNCQIDITRLYACIVDSDECLLSAAHLLQDTQKHVEGVQYITKSPVKSSVLNGDEHVGMRTFPKLEQQDCADEQVLEKQECDLIQARIKSVLTVLKSAAATIHLTVQDAFQRILAKLEECRKAVRSFGGVRNWDGVSLPTLDQEHAVDWRCTYDMLASLFSLREHISKKKIIFSAHVDWKFVEKALVAYQPMQECATRSQEYASYIVGDFYRDWLMCEAKLERLEDNLYAEMLLETMQRRKHELLENDTFLAALYLDPRFNYADSPLLNELQKRNALLHILDTNSLLELLNARQENDANGQRQQYNGQEMMDVLSDDPFDLLEVKISAISANSATSNSSGEPSASLAQKLEDLAYGERKPFSTDVLEHWKGIARRDRHLSQIALVVLSPAVSQARAQLTAETIAEIFTSEQQFSIRSNILNDFLFVKSNNRLLESISLDDEL